MGIRARFESVAAVLAVALAVLPSLAASTVRGAETTATPPTPESAAPPAKPAARTLPINNKAWTGDFDAMLKRGMIRALVPFSRTLYFNDNGHERGVTADFVRDFERWLNQKYAKQLGKGRSVTVYIIPTTRDRLLPALGEGLGDIAAGNLTITEARLATADFVSPENGPVVSEVVLTGPKSPELTSLDDLAGKRVHVRPSSSYFESLTALDQRFAAEKKPPIELVAVPDALEDEDMMEMLNAGILEAIVVDDWKAKIWAPVLPKMKVREDLVLRSGGKVGWAFRKESPVLRAALDEFWRGMVKREGKFAYRHGQYMKRIKQIANNAGDAETKRFEGAVDLFRKHGSAYAFDPLMLAAQGFQESQLRQDAKSHVGAVGVMQLMPATGKEMQVGDIRKLEPNIQAGAKYMDLLMTKYFQDAHFEGANRTLFAFASYNAGPARIAQMREEARKRGLDPNKWFNNVELVTAEKVGREPTTYVRNIYKLLVDAQERQRAAREQVGGAAAPAANP